jgi:hypothetical protein
VAIRTKVAPAVAVNAADQLVGRGFQGGASTVDVVWLGGRGVDDDGCSGDWTVGDGPDRQRRVVVTRDGACDAETPAREELVWRDAALVAMPQ